MSIGEFEEVGDVIKEFVSEEATVVIGTVIDPTLTDELHVTVVVTGLGNAGRTGTGRQEVRYGDAERPAMRFVESAARADGSVNYEELERPTVMRRKSTTAPDFERAQDVEYLDIPAFLRRKDREEA